VTQEDPRHRVLTELVRPAMVQVMTRPQGPGRVGLIDDITAIVLAEGPIEQSEILSWIYYNIYIREGLRGERGGGRGGVHGASAAHGGANYQLKLETLQQEIPPGIEIPGNVRRAREVREIVERIFRTGRCPFLRCDERSRNWINHGNISDINRDQPWFRNARRYFWLLVDNAPEARVPDASLLGVLFAPYRRMGEEILRFSRTQFAWNSYEIARFFARGGAGYGLRTRDDEITTQILRRLWEQGPPYPEYIFDLSSQD